MMGKYEGLHNVADREHRLAGNKAHFGVMSTELCQVILGGKSGSRLNSRQQRRAAQRTRHRARTRQAFTGVPGFISIK